MYLDPRAMWALETWVKALTDPGFNFVVAIHLSLFLYRMYFIIHYLLCL